MAQRHSPVTLAQLHVETVPLQTQRALVPQSQTLPVKEPPKQGFRAAVGAFVAPATVGALVVGAAVVGTIVAPETVGALVVGDQSGRPWWER